MEGNKYAMKGYSAYTHIPALGYDDGLQNFINPTYVPSNHYGSYERKHGVNQYSNPVKFHNEDIRPGVNHYSALANLNNDKIRPIKTSFFSNPTDYGPLSQVHGYHSEEAHLVRSEPGFKGRRQVRTSKTVPGFDKSWESATPPPTNNINEGLGFSEYLNYSPPLDKGKSGYFMKYQPVHNDKYRKSDTYVYRTRAGEKFWESATPAEEADFKPGRRKLVILSQAEEADLVRFLKKYWESATPPPTYNINDQTTLPKHHIFSMEEFVPGGVD